MQTCRWNPTLDEAASCLTFVQRVDNAALPSLAIPPPLRQQPGVATGMAWGIHNPTVPATRRLPVLLTDTGALGQCRAMPLRHAARHRLSMTYLRTCVRQSN